TCLQKQFQLVGIRKEIIGYVCLNVLLKSFAFFKGIYFFDIFLDHGFFFFKQTLIFLCLSGHFFLCGLKLFHVLTHFFFLGTHFLGLHLHGFHHFFHLHSSPYVNDG